MCLNTTVTEHCGGIPACTVHTHKRQSSVHEVGTRVSLQTHQKLGLDHTHTVDVRTDVHTGIQKSYTSECRPHVYIFSTNSEHKYNYT